MEIKTDKKIICIGDINPDLIIPYGKMKNFTRNFYAGNTPPGEKGPPVFMRPGGAMANTAVGLAKIGITPILIGKIGRDSLSKFIADDLALCGVDISYMAYQDDPTMVVVALLEENGEKTFFQWFPPGGKDKTFFADDLPLSLAHKADFVHINGSVIQDDKDSSQNVTHFIEEAASFGAIISFDLNLRSELYPMTPGRRSLIERALKSSTYIFGSGRDEWCPLANKDSLEQAASSYATKENCIVCRDGANPIILFNKGDRSIHPVPKVKLVNSVGAGDMFDAGFIACIACGGSPQDSVLWGNAIAGYAISHEEPRSIPPLDHLSKLIEMQR